MINGGTWTLFTQTLSKLGIEVRFFDPSKPEAIAKLVDKNTRAVYLESVGNPKNDVPDYRRIADEAHKHGLPVLIDNTVTTPALLRPIEHGIDIVIYSTTKFIGGHGVHIGGAILGFGIKGGRDTAVTFINNVKLASHLANVGDAKTLVIHPASTTHSQLTPQEQAETGVTPEYIRLSIGIEDVQDIIADLDQALAKSQQ